MQVLLLWNLFWLIVYFEKVPRAHRKCIIRFLPFFFFLIFKFTLKSICDVFWRHIGSTAFCYFVFFPASKCLFLLYKTINPNEDMATMSVYQCNVLQYCVFLFCWVFFKDKTNIFKELFCLLCCTYILLERSCRANKAAYFYFLHSSHLLFNNSDFHLCHFWQPVPLNN